MDAERRRWLESVAAACERVLAKPSTEQGPFALTEDVKELLARIQAELDEERD